VLDGRAYYPKDKIAELRAAGYTFRGIGRGTALGEPGGGAAGTRLWAEAG